MNPHQAHSVLRTTPIIALSTELITEFTAKLFHRKLAHPEAFPQANCPLLYET